MSHKTSDSLHSRPESLAETFRVFSRFASPRAIAVGFALAWAWRLLSPGWYWSDVAVVLAVLAFWPVLEWLIHVFVLHFRPRRIGSWTVDLFNAREHRRHHRAPWDLSLVFIPRPVVLVGLPLLFAGWLIALPGHLGATGLVITLTMTLHYEWGHYLAHSRYVPRSTYYRRMVRHHRLHHFKNERFWMGVSVLGGDLLLGTAPDPQKVQTSRTARSLGQPLG